MTHQSFQSSSGPIRNMYEFLTVKDRFTGQFGDGGLASSWSVLPDGKTWTFKLRENVPFYQNKVPTDWTFSSKDVLASLEMEFLDKANSGRAGNLLPFFEPPDNLTLVGDNTVIFSLKTPNVDWPEFVSDEQWGIISKDYLDLVGGDTEYAKNPIGTGPFTFKEKVLDSYFLFERVEDHWRKTPEFPELQFLFVREDATRFAMLLTEEASIADIPGTLLPQAEERGFKRVTSTLPSLYLFAVLGGVYFDNLPEYDPNEPLAKLKVRQALNHAIDRELIQSIFFPENSFPQAVHGMPPFREPYDPSWVPYEFDPDRARQLLIEAGYPNGLELDLLVTSQLSGVPEIPEIGEALIPMWEAVGFKMNIKEVELGQLVSDWDDRKNARTVNLVRYSIGPVSVVWPGVIKEDRLPIFHDEVLRDLYFNEYVNVTTVEEKNRLELAYGQRMYDQYGSLPILWISGQVAINPNVVAEYTSSMLNFGAARQHEFTKAVFK